MVNTRSMRGNVEYGGGPFYTGEEERWQDAEDQEIRDFTAPDRAAARRRAGPRRVFPTDDRAPPAWAPPIFDQIPELNWDPDSGASVTPTGGPNTEYQQVLGPSPSYWQHLNQGRHHDTIDGNAMRQEHWTLTPLEQAEVREEAMRYHADTEVIGADEVSDGEEACYVCHSSKGASTMLLCDGCDEGAAHTACIGNSCSHVLCLGWLCHRFTECA